VAGDRGTTLTGMSTHPLAPLVELPGVVDAAERAGDAVAAVHRHRANLRGWPSTAMEASWRGGRASAAIDGGSVELRRDGDYDDPVLAGAMRVAQALDGDSLEQLVGVYRRAPAQALARLHVLAAADLVGDPDELGRPRPGAEVSARLDMLGQVITARPAVPAAVVAAVVHGELLALSPFGQANGIVARGASRLACVATGLDPHNLGVPEVAWLRRAADYRRAVARFGEGTPAGVGEWILLCCSAFEAGAAEAASIADAASPR